MPCAARGLSITAIFGRIVAGEMVDRDHHRHAELADVGDVAGEVGRAAPDRVDIAGGEIGLGDAAVHLQRADGGDDAPRRRGSARPGGI